MAIRGRVALSPALTSNSGLSSSNRLKKSSHIRRCRDEGEKVYSKHFLLLVLPSDGPESRLAVAVTTKIDKRAVVRNLIKRRIREVFRLNKSKFTRAFDILVVARRDVQRCLIADYRRELLGALSSRGYLQARTGTKDGE